MSKYTRTIPAISKGSTKLVFDAAVYKVASVYLCVKVIHMSTHSCVILAEIKLRILAIEQYWLPQNLRKLQGGLSNLNWLVKIV